MPIPQFDPARLNGEALRGWYSRTPQELEEERQRRAEEAHRAFFSAPDAEVGDELELGQPEAEPSAANGVMNSSPQISQAAYFGAGGLLGGLLRDPGCQNCHGPTQGRQPPPSPFPSIVNPRTGGFGRSGAGNGGGGGKRKYLPECDMQEMQDLAICGSTAELASSGSLL